MCGRYATSRGAGDLAALFEAEDRTGGVLAPRYNVAPTDPAPVVRMSRGTGDRVLDVGRWGLLPPWTRDPRSAAKMINARAETLPVSRAYGPCFRARRALVPVDGWYEWRREDGRRQAYFLTSAPGAGFALAGLWADRGDGSPTFSVVTTAATGEVARVHDRMPLVLPPSRWREWLTAEPSVELLRSPPAHLVASMEIRPVGPRVGDVRNDGVDLVARVDPPPVAQTLW